MLRLWLTSNLIIARCWDGSSVVKIQFRSTQETQFHNYPYIATRLIGQPQPESINIRLMVGMSKRNPALVTDIERPFCVTVNIFIT